MLLEVRQSEAARDGGEAATVAILELFEGIREGLSASTLLTRWKPTSNPERRALERVLELPAEERQALAEAVEADLAFPAGLEDPAYRFSFQELAAATKQPAQALLASIYTRVFCRGKGFEFEPGRFVNRKVWEAEFRVANPGLQICPACAAFDLPEPVKSRSLNDVDHYLPKSRYPALAVHGLNLVLVCKACNEVLKGPMDPLSPADGACCLCDIWFPYVRAGLDEIELAFDPTAEGLQIQFVGEEAALTRARRYDEMFGVLEHWTGKLASIQENLPDNILFMGASHEAGSVRDALERLRRMAEGAERSDSQALVKSRYFAWLLQEPAAFRALVEEVKASAG